MIVSRLAVTGMMCEERAQDLLWVVFNLHGSLSWNDYQNYQKTAMPKLKAESTAKSLPLCCMEANNVPSGGQHRLNPLLGYKNASQQIYQVGDYDYDPLLGTQSVSTERRRSSKDYLLYICSLTSLGHHDKPWLRRKKDCGPHETQQPANWGHCWWNKHLLPFNKGFLTMWHKREVPNLPCNFRTSRKNARKCGNCGTGAKYVNPWKASPHRQ